MVEVSGLEPPEHQEAKCTHRQAFVVLAPKRVQAAIVGIWEEGRPADQAGSISDRLQPRAQSKIPKPGQTMIGREGRACIKQSHPLLFHLSHRS